MTIHLIKDTGLSAEVFTAVYDLLTATDGTIRFTCDPESIIDFSEDEISSRIYDDEETFGKKIFTTYNMKLNPDSAIKFPAIRHQAKWSTFFNKCKDYRQIKSIPEKDMVLLLTDLSNTPNWFATLDKDGPNNGFIHTADWDFFLSCPRKFPIAYEVIALILHRFSFDPNMPIMEQAHNRAIGCVSDLCIEKKEIILKMRTADVCGDCMTILKKHMPMVDIIHALNIMDSLRLKMLYAQNFKQHVALSKVFIDNRNNKIFLPDFGNIEIRLRPLEKALYLLFLEHPDGLYITELHDYRQRLMQIYREIRTTGLENELLKSINELVNVTTNSASEKISRIKRVFEEAVGPDLAKHYYIQGANGERKKVEIAAMELIG
jgi:hypothetical protein